MAVCLRMERYGGGWSSGEGWPQSASCGIPGMEVELEFGSEQGIDCRGDRGFLEPRSRVCVWVRLQHRKAAGVCEYIFREQVMDCNSAL